MCTKMALYQSGTIQKINDMKVLGELDSDVVVKKRYKKFEMDLPASQTSY